MTPAPDDVALVERSVSRYRRAHKRYERRHPEIFNEIEQKRLRTVLERAQASIQGGGGRLHALDFGCGAGNLTSHLVQLGFRVTAGDVSPDFLGTVEGRFADQPVTTLALNGVDLVGVPEASFDLVAAYSVLHHVPDYLGILDELVRVLRPGGVLVIDHEVNAEFWGPHGFGHRFREELASVERERPALWNPARHRWQRFLQPSWLAMRFRPAWVLGREGDIHVWADDRIEWQQLEQRLRDNGCEIVLRDDYLNFHDGYPVALWQRWRDDGCTDMRALIARRPFVGAVSGGAGVAERPSVEPA